MLRFLSVSLVLACFACGAETGDAAPLFKNTGLKPAILGSSGSDDSQDSVVMLLELDPTANKRVGICTGTLVAPNLVLTARHCVAEVNLDQMSCEVDGTPITGGEILNNHDPSHFFVFTGKNRPAFAGFEPPDLDTTKWQPAGQGLEIIDDKSGTLCNHDLALVLLKAPIPNAQVATIRLDNDTKPGEKLVTVGWGVSSSEIEPKQRQQRRDVTVSRVGPSENIPTLTKSEFLFDESICLGDSGGPIFSQDTNAVIAVVSRGGNGTDPGPTAGPAATCLGADNLGTQTASFKTLIEDAFKRANATAKVEPKRDEDDGCNASGGSSRPASVGWLACLLALALLRTRRRHE